MKNLKICRTLGCRAVLVLVSVALLLGGPPRATGQAPPVSTIQPAVSVMGGDVHGTIFALIRRGDTFPPTGIFGDQTIFLPDIPVFLQNATTLATSPTVTTDLDGAFVVPSQPQAVYRLCWKAAGYAPGCSPSTFTLRSRNVNLQPVGIDALPGVIFGRAALDDGRACRFVATFLGVNTFTTVTAQPSQGPAHTARANSYGEYVIPELPNGPVQTTATCEEAHASTQSTMTGAALHINLTLPNVSPTVQTAFAAAGGTAVRAVAAGTTVQATVQVKAGGFPLHYRWATDPPVSGFVSQDSPTISWQVPGPGSATIYVVARDEHGGNVLSHVTLSTTPNHIPFTGTVIANDVPVVADADVTINGVTGKTNSQGGFALILPKENPQYVVTIQKPGYQMLSRILYAPVAGATFKLFRAQDFVVDPSKPINVTEGVGERFGVNVVIPANSLAAGADGRGAIATAPLHLRPATYNLRDPEDQLPGDYAGIDTSNKAVRMQTFGAADIAIQDNAGQPFNLAPGKTAVVRISVDPAQLAGAPPTIPVWHYDAKQGAWLQDGAAMLVGGRYETTVTHFSPVNMDVAFDSGACTNITVDTAIMPVPFKIRMTPVNGDFVVDANHQNQIIGEGNNTVFREPPGKVVRFDMVDSNGNIIPGASQQITIGGPTPDGITWPPAHPPPYDCSDPKVQYNVQTVQALFPAPPQGFLSYLTPPEYKDDPVQAKAHTDEYYAKIDPGGTKTKAGDVNDFAHWKTANGFDRPSGRQNTKYFNNYDLGFGRDMHMQTGGQDNSCGNCIAYYVTNYASVNDAVNGVNQAATVAMEFSPQNGISGTPYTKFYVFNANGSIAESADLDQSGQKFVPALCVICHNGNISSLNLTGDSTGNLQTARFIPFDLQSFQYDPSLLRSAQESQFKEMNRGILNHTNASAPVQTLITLWYGTEGDKTLPNPTFSDADPVTKKSVPSLWTSPPIAPPDESALYTGVVMTSCRACHTTRDQVDAGQQIAWDSYDSINNDSFTVRNFACAPAGALHHIMPQAKRTFARFWLGTNPNPAATLANSNLDAFNMLGHTCQ
jgi:hypothetical protein